MQRSSSRFFSSGSSCIVIALNHISMLAVAIQGDGGLLFIAEDVGAREDLAARTDEKPCALRDLQSFGGINHRHFALARGTKIRQYNHVNPFLDLLPFFDLSRVRRILT